MPHTRKPRWTRFAFLLSTVLLLAAAADPALGQISLPSRQPVAKDFGSVTAEEPLYGNGELSVESATAGTTSWNQEGSDGSRGAAVSGNGGNALLAGSPKWTSDAITVTPGEILSLVVSAQSSGASSPATAGLVYLDASGNVLGTVTALSVPLTTGGFVTLEQPVTIPAGVAQVRVVLAGFAASDVATTGAVTFDDVGLFGN